MEEREGEDNAEKKAGERGCEEEMREKKEKKKEEVKNNIENRIVRGETEEVRLTRDRGDGEGEEREEWSHGMLERCRVADGGKMLLKFLEPGFLKRWRAEPEKS